MIQNFENIRIFYNFKRTVLSIFGLYRLDPSSYKTCYSEKKNFMNEIEIVKNHVKMSVGSIFSKLTAVVASPAVQNHHKIVIDRKTIEKTWKYMDKVKFPKFLCCLEFLRQLLELKINNLWIQIIRFWNKIAGLYLKSTNYNRIFVFEFANIIVWLNLVFKSQL